MNGITTKQHPGRGEFIALMAFLMSLVALSIDAILPAFYAIGNEYGVTEESRLSLIVGSLFLGLSIGNLLYGPLSDAIGRKPAVYVGLILFIIGSCISLFAVDYDQVLLGRVLQGFGVAAPRTLSIAFVRDLYSGREMAQVMSVVISVFIIVPALAPSLGLGIMWVSGWKAIFVTFICLTMMVSVWLLVRQPETLRKESRIPFRFGTIMRGGWEVVCNKTAISYTLIAGAAFSCLIAYLSVSKLAFYDIYGIDEMFPVFFGMLALAVGAASIINSKLVMRYGMRPLIKLSLYVMLVTALDSLFWLWMLDGQMGLWLFVGHMLVIFFFMGIIFGNSNAVAMEPMGHIAGIASSVMGCISTFVSMALGSLVAMFYAGDLWSLYIGFVGFIVIALLFFIWESKSFTRQD